MWKLFKFKFVYDDSKNKFNLVIPSLALHAELLMDKIADNAWWMKWSYSLIETYMSYQKSCEEPSFSLLLHQYQLFSLYPASPSIQFFIGILFYLLLSICPSPSLLLSCFISLSPSSFSFLLLLRSFLRCLLASFHHFFSIPSLSYFIYSLLFSISLPYPLLHLTLYLSFHWRHHIKYPLLCPGPIVFLRLLITYYDVRQCFILLNFCYVCCMIIHTYIRI